MPVPDCEAGTARLRPAAPRGRWRRPPAGRSGPGACGGAAPSFPSLPSLSSLLSFPSPAVHCAGGGAGAMAAQDGGGDEVRVLQNLRGKICKWSRGRVRRARGPSCGAAAAPSPSLGLRPAGSPGKGRKKRKGFVGCGLVGLGAGGWPEPRGGRGASPSARISASRPPASRVPSLPAYHHRASACLSGRRCESIDVQEVGGGRPLRNGR